MVSKSDESIEWAAERLLPVAIGSGPDWDDIRHKLDLYGQTAAKHGYADLSIRETLDRCWQLKQVHVAATTERAVDEYRDSLLWYFEALGDGKSVVEGKSVYVRVDLRGRRRIKKKNKNNETISKKNKK